MIQNQILENAKAYVSLIGALATALLGIYGPDTEVGHVLLIVVALATAFGTWATPNKDKPAD